MTVTALIVVIGVFVGLWIIIHEARKPIGPGVKRDRRGELVFNGFRPWAVDKQVIVEIPEAHSQSTALALRNDADPHFEWPRKIRVTITNRQQIHLIGDAALHDESHFLALVHEATEQCAFLNANEIK